MGWLNCCPFIFRGFNMSGYNAVLKEGQEVYIPSWPVSVALENLTKAGKYIGSDNLIRISELNIPSAMVAIMNAEDSNTTSELIKHFVCEARMDGEKIMKIDYDTKFKDNIYLAIEIFCHVVRAQYYDFFKQGLAKEPSQED